MRRERRSQIRARGRPGLTIRNAAYDPCELRGKRLAHQPGRTRRYFISAAAARTLREHDMPLFADIGMACG